MKKVGKSNFIIKLKQFLKPDWRKIAIWIIIFIVAHTHEWNGVLEGIYLQILTNYGTIAFTFVAIIDALIIYLLSCLVVWIYDKFRKRK